MTGGTGHFRGRAVARAALVALAVAGAGCAGTQPRDADYSRTSERNQQEVPGGGGSLWPGPGGTAGRGGDPSSPAG